MSKVGAIRETHINATRGYLMGEPMTTADPFTDDVGELFRFGQKEYGRCVSSIYVDTDEGTKRIGWVFQRQEPYTDSPELYTHEVWVELLEKPDTTETTSYPVNLS